MARQHRSHSVAFKRQVAEEFLAGETLHGLAKRHDLCRNLIRVWVAKYEAGAFDEDAGAAQGLMRCTHGNSAMTPTHTRRRGRLHRYYVCLGASRRGHDTCPVQQYDGRACAPPFLLLLTRTYCYFTEVTRQAGPAEATLPFWVGGRSSWITTTTDGWTCFR